MTQEIVKHAQAYASEAHKGNAEFIEAAEDAYLMGAAWANEQNEKELAALRAENAKLREALGEIKSELPQTPKLPIVWKVKEIAESSLNSITPDPLYLAAPEMLEALLYCPDKLMLGEFYADAERCRKAIAKAKGETYKAQF